MLVAPGGAKRNPGWKSKRIEAPQGRQTMAENLTTLSKAEFDSIAAEIDRHTGLNQVLAWAATKPKDEVHAQFVAEVITQDEFTHDVIVPYRKVFLVYDTT